MRLHPFIQRYWQRAALETALLALLALALAALAQTGVPGGGLAADFFWTPDNARFLAAQALAPTFGALGMALVLLAGGMDLSAGAGAALAGVTAAFLLQKGTPLFPALGYGLAAGTALGALNGLLAGCARREATPWALTLGTFGIALGAARWLGGEAPVAISAASGSMATLRGLNLAPALAAAALLAVFLALILRATVFGRHLRATGSNPEAARLCGVRTRLTRALVYTTAGLFFALAGLARMAVAGEAGTRSAVGLELTFLTAAMLGGVRLGGGEGGAIGAFVGALAVTALQNAAQQAGWPVPLQAIALGGLLIVAVAVNSLRYRGNRHPEP